jgi:hypothetical protein
MSCTGRITTRHGRERDRWLTVLRSLAISLLRLKGVKNIKEATEWVAGDRDRALHFMTT